MVESDQYGAAAGMNQMVNSLYALFGVGIATMVYWTFGIYGSILVNTLTFYYEWYFDSNDLHFRKSSFTKWENKMERS